MYTLPEHVTLVISLYMYAISDIDECTMYNPCENNGLCQNAVGSYSCNCVAGFTGTNCESGKKIGITKF